MPIIRHPSTPTDERAKDRLFRFVVRSTDPKACWGWSGSKKRHGYGRVRIDYVEHIASRLSWAVHNGSDPGDASVCHRCDNPECTNPAHLFLGTHAQNIQDAANKGKRMGFGARPQHNRGSANPMARLSEDNVAEIKKARAEGLTYRQLGERFGIHPGYAERIVNGRRRREDRHSCSSSLVGSCSDRASI